ncbi:MAG: hypothetical protein E6Q94_00040 [Burkholderiaceae bacterium]|nr:MAG: hypothetical protein E6Q94_00040 [Burkholderiaceae bacterium]
MIVVADFSVPGQHIWRLDQAGIRPSVGSRGDSYDNALAEIICVFHIKFALAGRGGVGRGCAVRALRQAVVGFLCTCQGHVAKAA